MTQLRTDPTGTVIPAGYHLEVIPTPEPNVQEWDVIQDGGRNVGTIIRRQYSAGHAYEVLAGYRSTDPEALGDAVRTAVEMRNRWDGIGA